jgi:hypothetical protein
MHNTIGMGTTCDHEVCIWMRLPGIAMRLP